ncbi:MFS general substrate transporter [Durotheca rogersii]|uniref:MFS general substrate transporter n=1 Tax=Durotheca rogersii TaxID=419775 RepID=UPI0022206E44|nr:MFS general substrate transporter [Durotheca rogersii]KAI5865600.1 MFS general substrate transporter [Durotheca rogersii]
MSTTVTTTSSEEELRPGLEAFEPDPDDIEAAKATEDLQIRDPNIVDWDGPDDPENPMNWSGLMKGLHVAYVSTFVLLANLASTMFAPGAKDLIKEFGITSSIVGTFTVSIYVLGFMIGPLAFAPLSELYGRLGMYHVCNVVYLAFTLGCALSNDVASFLVFRFICGCASAGPLTIGGGTIADVTVPKKRAKALAMFIVGPLIGPVIGPIVGGFVAQDIGWRWTFWIILIFSGTLFLASLFFLRETNAAAILKRKTERLRKETGNLKLTSKLDTKLPPRELFVRAIVLPAKMIVFSPIVLLMSLYGGMLFGLIFLLFTTFPSVFGEQYGFSPGTTGLAYLGLGIGFICGLLGFTTLSDKLLGQGGAAVKPEQRLILMKWFAPITPIGCFVYGWTAYFKVHWIAPEIGTFIIGFGGLFIMLPSQAYLVDAFGPRAAASALAANVVIRSPFGAFLTLAAPSLYSNLGLGWGNSLLGFICLAFTPVPWLFYRYGEHLRTRFAVTL